MSNRSKGRTPPSTEVCEGTDVQEPKCLAIAKEGIATGSQFAGFMSALMSDLIQGNINPQVGNAAVNAGGKLLKVVEMQYRYGKAGSGQRPRDLSLIGLPE